MNSCLCYFYSVAPWPCPIFIYFSGHETSPVPLVGLSPASIVHQHCTLYQKSAPTMQWTFRRGYEVQLCSWIYHFKICNRRKTPWFIWKISIGYCLILKIYFKYRFYLFCSTTTLEIRTTFRKSIYLCKIQLFLFVIFCNNCTSNNRFTNIF